MSDISISLAGVPSSPPSIVAITPPDIAHRRLANWGAIQADTVKVTRRETFDRHPAWLSRNELIYEGISQTHRTYADRISASPRELASQLLNHNQGGELGMLTNHYPRKADRR
jgi:hypothetical protein